jgi:uncharacterized protein (DUF302 family)
MVFEETVVLTGPFDDVVAATKSALADHGFGVLTEIDMQQTLQSKIGKQIERYLILGACNPTLASAASRWNHRSACCCRATSWCTKWRARSTSTRSTPG